jgi:hypothetical protein
MMPECNLQIELFPDIALSTQLRPAGMENIGGARGDFREGLAVQRRPCAIACCGAGVGMAIGTG